MSAVCLVAYDHGQEPLAGWLNEGLDGAAIRDSLVRRLPEMGARLSGADPEGLAAAVERGDHLLVVMAAPEDSLAACLAASEDAPAALAGWIASRRSLLALQRGNRRRVTLVDISLLTGGQDTDWQTLARRVDGGAQQPAAPLPAETASRVPAPFRLAALALSLCDAEAAEVIAALDAATLGRARGQDTRPVLEAVQAWRDRTDEATLLRESLSAQLDLYEQSARDGAARQQEAATLEARLQGLIADYDAALAARSNAEDAAELLRENLAAQLDLHEQTLREARSEGAAQRDRAAELEGRLKAVLSDFDRTRQALSQSEAESATLQERQSLIEENIGLQLEQAEEIGHRYEVDVERLRADLAQSDHMVLAERTAREGQVRLARTRQARRDAVLGARLLDEMALSAQLRAELAWKGEQIDNASQDVAELRDELSRITRQSTDQKALIDAMSAELDTVYGSKSWRMTGPLRAAMTRLGSSSRS